jgi:hypothetical protein
MPLVIVTDDGRYAKLEQPGWKDNNGLTNICSHTCMPYTHWL